MDVAQLFRDDDRFASVAEAVAGVLDPDIESVPAWRGAGTTYSGIDGFREMWLDWLEPWASYHVQVDEMIEVDNAVVVFVRDRALRPGMDVEVELISGSLWTFRDDRIVRVHFYANREELREAVGLES
jgi:ketosteroid isomerase-like protein